MTVDTASGCWRWTGAHNDDGYGVTQQGVLAHRLVYASVVACVSYWELSPDPIDHVAARGCQYRDCINPLHLEQVTQRENVRRARNANRDKLVCPRGHDYRRFSVVYTGADGYTRRYCRICREVRNRIPVLEGRIRRNRGGGHRDWDLLELQRYATQGYRVDPVVLA